MSSIGHLYDYLADGTKILHEYSDGQQDEYRGSLVYYSNGEFSVPFGGGRLVSEGNTTEAHYFLTDHLGSTRVVAKVTPTGRVDLDRKDYYPFGKTWSQPNMPTSSNRYTFSGKEQQRVGLAATKLLDFGARFYDSDGVIFIQQDPLLEKYVSIGQYNYCAGNPVSRIDFNGADWYSYEEEYEDEEGNKRTEIRYKYVQGTMSEEEMLQGNYTHLGRTYEANGTYYSLGGAEISYDENNYWEMAGVRKIKDADLSVMGTIDAINMVGDFWQKYDGLISTGSDLGVMIGNFMELSKGFQGVTNAFGIGSTVYNFFRDSKLIINGDLHGVGLSNAAVNIVSVMGAPGAAISVGYATAKAGARGVMKLEGGLQSKANELYKRYTGMYAGFGF